MKIKSTLAIFLALLTNVNAQDLDISKPPKDKQVIVYCRSGRRSSIVGHELQKRGFRVLNMGSFDSWKSAGFETEEKRK